MERRLDRSNLVFGRVFVGIYLPVGFRDNYGRLLKFIRKNDPTVETVGPYNPHITLLSLGYQTGRKISRVAEAIADNSKLLSGKRLTVGGFNETDFNPGSGKGLLSLNVEDCNLLQGFATTLNEKIIDITGRRKDPHRSHVTVGYSDKMGLLEVAKVNVITALQKICWEFELNEVAIFGKPYNRQFSNRFVTLATIPVDGTPRNDIYSRSHPHSRRYRDYNYNHYTLLDYFSCLCLSLK